MMTLSIWTDFRQGARAIIIIVINRHSPLLFYTSTGCAIYDDNDENTHPRARTHSLFFIVSVSIFLFLLQTFSISGENDNNNHKNKKGFKKQNLNPYDENMIINYDYYDLRMVAL